MPESVSLAAIIGMALVTYATRTAGFWAMRWMPQTPRVEAWLRQIPGAVLVSIIAPMAAASGWPERLALAVAAVTMLVTRQDLIAIIAGVATVAVLRGIGF